MTYVEDTQETEGSQYTDEQLAESYADALEFSRENEEEEEMVDMETDSTASGLSEIQPVAGQSKVLKMKRERRNPGVKSARLNDKQDVDFAIDIEQTPAIFDKTDPDFKTFDKEKFYTDHIEKYKLGSVNVAQLENFYIHRRTMMSKIINKEKKTPPTRSTAGAIILTNTEKKSRRCGVF